MIPPRSPSTSSEDEEECVCYSMYTGVTFHTVQIDVDNLAINLTVDDHEKRLGLLEEGFVRMERKMDLLLEKMTRVETLFLPSHGNRLQPQQRTAAIQPPSNYSSFNTRHQP